MGRFIKVVSMAELVRLARLKAKAGVVPIQHASPEPNFVSESDVLDDGADCAEEGHFLLGVDRYGALSRHACPTDDCENDDEIAELIDSETGEYPVHDDLMVSSAMMAAIDDPEDVEDIGKP